MSLSSSSLRFPPVLWVMSWILMRLRLGRLDFGWVLDRDVMMNVIVLPTVEIGFAYSVHGERNDGKAIWEGTLPLRILEAFDRVFDREGLDG